MSLLTNFFVACLAIGSFLVKRIKALLKTVTFLTLLYLDIGNGKYAAGTIVNIIYK